MTPAPTVAFVRLATARRTACGIREADDGISCWGSCTPAACTPPAGRFDSLVLHDDGGGCAWGHGSPIQCWGDEHFLRGAAPPESLRAEPTRALAFGADWGILQRLDGTIALYGRARPPGEQFVGNDPVLAALAASGEPVLAVAGSGATACVISRTFTGTCVAYYGSGKPPESAGKILGYAFSDPMGVMPACVLAGSGPMSGSVACTAGVKGATPRLLGSEFVSITAGDDHVCGIDLAGSVSCGGLDQHGQVTGISPWP